MTCLITYLAGLLTLPVLAGALHATMWAFGRDTGNGSCYVCPHARTSEPGERRNLSVWVARTWHSVFWGHRRWHRKAWAESEWNTASR